MCWTEQHPVLFISQNLELSSVTLRIFGFLNNAILVCSVPGPPADVNVYAFAEYILVTWAPPKEPNGIIRGYQVGSAEYTGSQWKDITVDLTALGADKRRHLLSDQKELSLYVVEIQAKTDPGWGDSVRKTTATVKMSGKF